MSVEAYNLFLSHTKIWELFISALIPTSVVLFGLFVNQRIKYLESELQLNQSLISKRIALYEQLREPLNNIFCACYYVGNWRSRTPPDLLKARRMCDEIF